MLPTRVLMHLFGALLLVCVSTALKAQGAGTSSTVSALSVGDLVLTPGSQPAPSTLLDEQASWHAPLHLIYVHGIAEIGPGDSALVRWGICKYYNECETTADPRVYAEGPFSLNSSRPTLTYLGRPVWADPDEWNAATPYFQRFHISGNQHARPILLDEINWYPLVYTLKCKFLVPVDERLIGKMKTEDKACRPGTVKENGRYLSYNWNADTELLKTDMPQRHATLINGSLKASVLDWGLSEAAMSVGPMQPILCAAIRQLLAQSLEIPVDAEGGTPRSLADQNVPVFFVTHSLGSFLSIMSVSPEWSGEELRKEPNFQTAIERQFAVTEEQGKATKYFSTHTNGFFFLANQLALLELGGLAPAADLKASPELAKAAVLGPAQQVTPSLALEHYGRMRTDYLTRNPEGPGGTRPPQVVAWSDPNDLLSWYVPRLPNVLTVNRAAHNPAFRIPWIVAWPTSIHSNYARNKHVIRDILKPTRHKEQDNPLQSP